MTWALPPPMLGTRSTHGAGAGHDQSKVRAWSATIDGRKLKLGCARHFLAGVLIGASLWLSVFLAVE